ncbi:MAG: heparinase II/III family protein [Opitutaceae bacterium]
MFNAPVTPRSLLTRAIDGTTLRPLLIPPAEFHPYPTIAERAAWDGLPALLREALISAGEVRLGEPWEILKASVQLGYVRTGNRADFEAPMAARRSRLSDLVFAECVENCGRFIDAIADGVWLICEETFWAGAAHLFMQRRGLGLPDVTEPIVDLGVGETAGLLAWTHYLLGARLDGVHPMLCERIKLEIERRVLTPCLERDDFWWMGWHRDNRPVNNWNPWCCANWLACVLIFETDLDRRNRGVHKIMRILDIFIDHQPADGGCDEGPNYWARAAGSLWECLDLIHLATAGRVDIFGEPLIKEMGRFVQRTHAAGLWFVNFADAPVKSGTEAVTLYMYGRAIRDAEMMAFGAWLFQERKTLQLGGSMNRALPRLWLDAELNAPSARPPLYRDQWLPDLQIMVARDQAGSSEGFFVAAKGGHNEESHNHNDIGTLTAYLDGWPLLIDIGVETYTAKTFDARYRYAIWTMQSQWHNLPTVNGMMQENGLEFAARDARHAAAAAEATLQLELAGAWPKAAGITTWTRTIRLERGVAVTVSDDYELSAVTEPAVFNFITARPVDLSAAGLVRFSSFPTAPTTRGAVLAYDASALTAAVDTVEVTDPWLKTSWTHVYRIRLTERTPTARARREFRLTAAN